MEEPRPTLFDLQRTVQEIERKHDWAAPAIARAEAAPIMLENEPFGRWLLAQRDRGDWVDELASACRKDPGFPKDGSPDDVRKRLTTFGAEGDVFEQVDDAEKAWLTL